MKFYKQTYTIVVLTEKPGEIELDDLAREVNEGDSVLFSNSCEEIEIKPKEMAELLYGAGSVPEFFGLDSDGNEV